MRESPLHLLAASLGLALVATDATADQRWLEVRSPHFRVITDAGEKEGRAVATGFEQLRKLFQSLGNMRVDPSAPIDIVATRDEAGFRALLPSFWERRGGLRPGGVFMAGTDKHHIVLRLDVDPDFRDDLVFHEYVHLVVKLNFASLPVWLNEGLAEFYAGTTVRDDHVLFGRVSGPRLAVLRQRAPLPLADLFAIDGGSREYNEQSRASVLYAESALLTHYLLIGDKGAHRAQLIEYLRLLGQGTAPEQAQQSAFGDLKALQKAFFSYLHRYQFLAISSPLDVSGTTATARPMSEAEVLVVRGEVLAHDGRDQEARALLTKARELDPRLPAAAQALGRFESLDLRQEAARPHLDDAVRLAPDDFMSHFLWAQSAALRADSAQLAAAEAAARRSLQLNPSFAPAHALLSFVLRREGKLEPAFVALHKACELEPDNASYWLRRADLLRDMKKPEIAEAIEGQIAQMAATDPEKLRAVSAHYQRARRLEDLERILRKAADLSPRSTLAPMMLGGYLRDQGRADEAEAAFRRALAAQPDNPSILNNLAYFNADRGVKLPESLEMIERALKAYPDAGAMLDTKGWILFRMGRLDEAERYLRRALQTRDDAEILEHLGDVLDGRGQKAPAQEMWRRALEHPALTPQRKKELQRKLGAPEAPPSPAS